MFLYKVMQNFNIDIEKLSDDLISIGNLLKTLTENLGEAIIIQENLLQNIEFDLLAEDNINKLYNSVEQIEMKLCRNLEELDIIHDRLKQFETEDLSSLKEEYEFLNNEYKEIEDITNKINKEIDSLKNFTDLSS